ncbi:hypothetical protein GSI_04060 [Ganoderma sinense ZZ0214-1]|uniref:Exoribonuclease phosphorolytic domain-containing protein n=1 Tax=Ganoderma sinense ZZ0214-1 TaxID=1077348 RepID=A0A2G8SIQ6_9APHY|nr:hypothetical protein GSI_04060 [Ganoderma sinense ZZ0214-1]
MAAHTRPGGRRPDETRQITITYEGLDRVDGSARFGFGPTKSLASVSGPIEVRIAHEHPSQATLDIQVRPLPGIPGTDAKALATTLKSIFAPSLFLSHHPRTLVQVVAQALCGSESGSGTGSAGRGWNASLVASLVNATAAALINAASVPMRGVVCAVAVGKLRSEPEQGGLLLDPEEAELGKLAGSGCFAFLFSSSLPASGSASSGVPQCSLLWTNYTTTAPFDVTELGKARELAKKGAREGWLALKESIGSHSATAVLKTELKGEPSSQSITMEVDDEKVEI